MATAAHHLPTLHAPTPGGAWRALLVGAVLLVALCEVAAQGALPPAAYQDAALIANRAEETGSVGSEFVTSTEVNAVRNPLVSPVVLPLAGADGRVSYELAGVAYRWWLTRGRAGVGLGFGALGYLMPSSDGRIGGSPSLVGAVPMLTVGVRYRVSEQSHLFADASGARGLGADPGGAYYNTKVGVEWQPAKSRLGLEQGALGLHFDSGYKLSLKARHGGLGLYLRSQF